MRTTLSDYYYDNSGNIVGITLFPTDTADGIKEKFSKLNGGYAIFTHGTYPALNDIPINGDTRIVGYGDVEIPLYSESTVEAVFKPVNGDILCHNIHFKQSSGDCRIFWYVDNNYRLHLRDCRITRSGWVFWYAAAYTVFENVQFWNTPWMAAHNYHTTLLNCVFNDGVVIYPDYINNNSRMIFDGCRIYDTTALKPTSSHIAIVSFRGCYINKLLIEPRDNHSTLISFTGCTFGYSSMNYDPLVIDVTHTYNFPIVLSSCIFDTPTYGISIQNSGGSVELRLNACHWSGRLTGTTSAVTLIEHGVRGYEKET